MDKEFNQKERNELARLKCRQLNLHYDIHKFRSELSEIQKYFYLIMSGLTLLSMPSRRKVEEEELAALYHASFESFLQSRYWQGFKEEHVAKMNDEFSSLNETQQKICLSKRTERLQKERDNFLKKFEIRYHSANTEKSIGRFCRQIYERLNGICLNENAEIKLTEKNRKAARMTHEDLCYYFAVEAMIDFYLLKIEEVSRNRAEKEKCSQSMPDHPGKAGKREGKSPVETKSCRIFNSVVSEDKLADCFYGLYDTCFGESQSCILEGNCDKTTFAVYLFLLVEKEGLGKSDFGEHCKKPFFEFIQNRVITDIDKTVRTFNNRLAKLGELRRKILNETIPAVGKSTLVTNPNDSNFHKILGNFHRTHYFHELQKLKKK